MIAQPLFQRPPTALPGYQRPPDWLPLTDMSSTEGFNGLHAVWNDDANFCAFTCAGAYTVDWGDGSTPENFASGATAYHNFAWSDYDASTLTSRGYRQAVITVTPQAGQTLTNTNLAVKHNQSGLADNYATGWLDIEIYGPNLTTLLVSAGGNWARHRLLEKCTFYSIGSVTSMANMFANCSSFQSVPAFDTSGVTSMQNMFSSCSSLQNVPAFDTSSVTNMAGMFATSSLQSVPGFDTSKVTSMANMFANCSSFQSVPAFDTGGVTAVAGMFLNCNSLSRFEATGMKVSVSFANCKLSAADLDEIYTNLATVTGQTITVTGNYGTASDNPSIATAKGWSVTG
jgi:surface protein